MNDLEEGTEARLEFGKIQSAAASSSRPLVPVVLQHADTLAVLYVGYADEEAVTETQRTGRATLWSTSRNELWRKGATSGDWLDVVDIRVNCEQNSLLYLVRPATGSACHTRDHNGIARSSCYYRRLSDSTLEPL